MKLPSEIQITSIKDTINLAQDFISHYIHVNTAPPYPPIALTGVIGAGKSTFVRHCLEYTSLILDAQEFSSPSFNLIHEYYGVFNNIPVTIYHIDLYRLNSNVESKDIGLYDILQEHICFIEWPERIQWNITKPFFYIDINITAENQRFIKITYTQEDY